ncbi:MAG: DP-EP family protein [Paraglaciecola sp.]|uniref:DP-EP family protein n=1 Tax=Paraglaciecola sp. TaxID=1920173 RepID=UPI003265667D
MSNQNPPVFSFNVKVIVNNNQPTFSYTDIDGNPSDGNVTVSVDNTKIIYRLATAVNPEERFDFDKPEITGDTGSDLTYRISADKQTITIVDTDADKEDVCLKLVVSKSYTSPDPTITNKGRE